MNFEDALQKAQQDLDNSPKHEMVLDLLSKPKRTPNLELLSIPRAAEFPEEKYLTQLALLKEYIESLEIPNKTKEVEEFILNCVCLVSDSWVEYDDSSILDNAIQIVSSIDVTITSNNAQAISDQVIAFYLKDKVVGYKRSLYLKSLNNFVAARIPQLLPGSTTLANEASESIRAKSLESNVRTVLNTANDLFERYAKKDQLSYIIRDVIEREVQFGKEEAFEQIIAISKDKLHGIAARILWQIKRKLENLTPEQVANANITTLLNTVAEEIICSQMIREINTASLKLVIKAVYNLIEFGEDTRKQNYYAKNILIETYLMPALKHTVEKPETNKESEPQTLETLTGKKQILSAIKHLNSIALGQRTAVEVLNDTSKINYGGLFRTKLRSAMGGLVKDSELKSDYEEALKLSDSNILVTILTLVENLSIFLESKDDDSGDTLVLLQDFYNFLNTHGNRYIKSRKIMSIVREFFKVIACDGRLFTWNAASDEYEPILIEVDKIFDQSSHETATQEAKGADALIELTTENYLEELFKRGLTAQQIAEVKMFAQSQENKHYLDMINFVISTVHNREDQSIEQLAELIFSKQEQFGLRYNPQDWHAVLRRAAFLIEDKSTAGELLTAVNIMSVRAGNKIRILKEWTEIAEV